MTTKITRDVILDLLPLYLAEEASADTRALVEEYLKTDPELARTAKEYAAAKLPGDIPVPLSKEDQMEAFKKTQRHLFYRTVFLAGLLAFILLSCTGLTVLVYFMSVSS